MKRVIWILIGILTATVVAIITAITVTATPAAVQEGTPPPGPVVVAGSESMGSVPSLSPQQEESARAISSGSNTTYSPGATGVAPATTVDPSGRPISEPLILTYSHQDVWHNGQGVVIGSVVVYKYSRPAKIVGGSFKALDYDCSETRVPPYRGVPYTTSYTNVTELLHFVELKTGRTVATEPGSGATLLGDPVYADGAPPDNYSDTCGD